MRRNDPKGSVAWYMKSIEAIRLLVNEKILTKRRGATERMRCEQSNNMLDNKIKAKPLHERKSIGSGSLSSIGGSGSCMRTITLFRGPVIFDDGFERD